MTVRRLKSDIRNSLCKSHLLYQELPFLWWGDRTLPAPLGVHYPMYRHPRKMGRFLSSNKIQVLISAPSGPSFILENPGIAQYLRLNLIYIHPRIYLGILVRHSDSLGSSGQEIWGPGALSLLPSWFALPVEGGARATLPHLFKKFHLCFSFGRRGVNIKSDSKFSIAWII